MPLVRFQVRNEYGLGQPELYRAASREDPKAVLDGVAVAGLVGILRQLGDLAEFAAEVFHGLQEQVMTTASRSHKLMIRVQNIEAALPPLEKAVLAQSSHIHFAYTAGSEWHPRIQNDQNHFIYNELPRFIMDSYEECRDPPRLHRLDKFDVGGPGSCLKRYSDPTFFRRIAGNCNEQEAEEVQKDKKPHKSRKKRSSKRHGDLLRSASMSNHSDRMQATQPTNNRRSSSFRTASTFDMALKSDLGDYSNSFDSRTSSSYIEGVFHPSSSIQCEEESREFNPKIFKQDDVCMPVSVDIQPAIAGDKYPHCPSPEQVARNTSCVVWDEKVEILEHKGQDYDLGEVQEIFTTDSDQDTQRRNTADLLNPGTMDVVFDDEKTLESNLNRDHLDEVESEPGDYMDALNTIELEFENEVDCQIKHEVDQFTYNVNCRVTDDGMCNGTAHISDDHPSKSKFHTLSSNISSNEGTCCDLQNSVPLNSVSHEQKSNFPGNSFNSDHLQRFEGSAGADVLDGSKVESAVSDLPNSLPKSSFMHETLSNTSGKSPNSNHSSAIEVSTSADATDGSKVESVARGLCDPAPSNTFVHEPMPDTSGKSLDCSPMVEGSRSADASDSSKMASVGGDLCNSVPSVSLVHEKTSYIPEKSSNSGHSPGTEGSAGADVLYGPKVVVSDPLFSGPGVPNLQEHLSNRSLSSSSNCSVSFWTNGGLLGLEPSKPPDFAAGRNVSQDSATRSKDEASTPSNHTFMPSNNGEGGKADRFVKDSGSMERVLSSKYFESLDREQSANVEKFSDSCHSNGSTHTYGGRLNIANAVTQGNGLLHDTDVKATFVGAIEENSDNSSKVFGYGPRLLVNGFGRQTSVVHDCKPELPSSMKTSTVEQKSGHQNVTYEAISERSFNGQLGRKSSMDILTSSPPLEHMKMSFHPINGFEASKLKLKFPDGSHFNEGTSDLFPSFQLVPEAAVPLHEAGSDTDDDTFCRSSPYMSDDYRSHHSDSDSEQWESGESPESKDHALYDSLARVSAVESVSGSLQSGETGNGGIHVETEFKGERTENGADGLDLPCFDAVNTVLNKEHKDSPGPQDILHLQYPTESSPLPPPLPPVQWWVSNPHLDVAEVKHHAISEARPSVFDLTTLSSSLSQLKPAPVNEEQTNKDAIVFKPKSKQQDQQKQNLQKEVNQPANGKRMDEKEDFLQQIRTKSFALRRTSTTKSTFTSGGTANDKVTAILKKANAIRQAVGSDDGEDEDTWSDS